MSTMIKTLEAKGHAYNAVLLDIERETNEFISNHPSFKIISVSHSISTVGSTIFGSALITYNKITPATKDENDGD